jgi:hypothetical protein
MGTAIPEVRIGVIRPVMDIAAIHTTQVTDTPLDIRMDLELQLQMGAPQWFSKMLALPATTAMGFM